MRIDPAKTQKEPTYQVVLDALALTTCYLAFLITADVPKIYMQQFWFTINKKVSTTYQFKIDKKSYRINMEVFKEIFQICLRLPNQDFDELPSDEEIEDFRFKIKNRDYKKQENMYYLGFTKAIIHHFITKDKSILMRIRMFMHIARDDIILGPMRFVSKSDNFQVYGALLPNRVTNQQMLDSNAYKTYLAYGTSAPSPKINRKVKRHASPSKKRTLVTVEEEEPEPAKKVIPTKKTATKRQYSSVQIRDTHGVSMSKKKAPAKVARRKGIELLSDAALLEEAQLKKALKRSKRETNIHQAGGSSEGADFKSDVPDKPKGKSIDTSKGTGLKPGVPDVSKESDDEPQHVDDERIDSENQETNDDDEETEDEIVHTPQNYVPTDDETNDESNDVTKEEYERMNEELYGDVNVNLTDAEPADLEKDDEEMTVTGHVNVNQEDTGNQVKDDAQATQKTKGPIPSSFISSDYADKYRNFDNIHPIDTKVVTMLDINVQHEDVKELKDVDNSIKVISTIQSEVPKAIKEYLESSLDDAMHKVIQRNFPDIIKEHSSLVEIMQRLKQQYVPQKSIEDIQEIKMEHARKQQSFNKSPKQRAQYHALIESILEDEDVMDEGVADKLKKRKPDYADKDEGPSTRSDRGLKRQKTNKDIKPSKKAKLTETSKGTSKSQPKSTGKSGQAEETVDLAKAKRPSRKFDDLMSTLIDFNAFVMNRLQISELTQDILVGPNYNIIKGTCRSYVKHDYNMEECYKALANQLNWNNPEGNRYPFDLSKPPPLVMSVNLQIIQVDYFFNNDLAYLQGGSTGRTYTTSLTKTKDAKYDLPGIEDMVPNLWSPVKVAYANHALLGTSQWGPKDKVSTDMLPTGCPYMMCTPPKELLLSQMSKLKN
nr:hypothetical protein [Tanacetum cinerariifolium]